MNSQNVDLSPFDESEKDDVKIGDNKTYVPCRVCQQGFSRIRLTQLYCFFCKEAFCEGEHGAWFGKGNHAQCVKCRFE